MAVRVITLGLLICLSIAAFADTLTGKVVKITDGDTLYVLDANYKQHKIRLAGIDAPDLEFLVDVVLFGGEVEAGHDRSPRSCLCRPFLGG